MKRALFTLGILIVLTLVVLPGCETDQAVTGIRISNETGESIMSVMIGPPILITGPELLSSPIPNLDYRDFETPAGVFDVRVQLIDDEATRYFRDLTVVDGQVTICTVDAW